LRYFYKLCINSLINIFCLILIIYVAKINFDGRNSQKIQQGKNIIKFFVLK